eukprot:SAG31_NODE_2168_length_6266_cov_11.946976_2_plen_337_part_00
MLLSEAQLASYAVDGYIVVPCPWPHSMTQVLQEAVLTNAASEAEMAAENAHARSTQFRLLPQPDTGSQCNFLDQSLEFLQVMLHPELLELARQLEGTNDVYFRNGGINELRPDKSILWHHDYKNDSHCRQAVATAGVEFMHYFGGASVVNGCLRLIPRSHSYPSRRFGDGSHANQSDAEIRTQYEKELDKCRVEAGLHEACSWSDSPGRDSHPEDVYIPGEVSIELTPDELLIRSTSIFHATHANNTGEGRLMHHWLIRPKDAGAGNHRWHWEQHLSPYLVSQLMEEQRAVLMLGEAFEIDTVYDGERRQRANAPHKVMWGALCELRRKDKAHGRL